MRFFKREQPNNLPAPVEEHLEPPYRNLGHALLAGGGTGRDSDLGISLHVEPTTFEYPPQPAPIITPAQVRQQVSRDLEARVQRQAAEQKRVEQLEDLQDMLSSYAGRLLALKPPSEAALTIGGSGRYPQGIYTWTVPVDLSTRRSGPRRAEYTYQLGYKWSGLRAEPPKTMIVAREIPKSGPPLTSGTFDAIFYDYRSKRYQDRSKSKKPYVQSIQLTSNTEGLLFKSLPEPARRLLGQQSGDNTVTFFYPGLNDPKRTDELFRVGKDDYSYDGSGKYVTKRPNAADLAVDDFNPMIRGIIEHYGPVGIGL